MTTRSPSKRLERHLLPEVFGALAEPTRICVLIRLAVARAPLTVSEVANGCGVHLSGVSRHLKILREAGVVTSTKRGREVLYSLDCASLAASLRGAADALDACHAACCPKKEVKE